LNSARRHSSSALVVCCWAALSLLSGCSEDSTGPDPAPGSLGGFVLDPANDAPVIGAVVTVESTSKDSSKVTRNTQTDSDGEYRFTELEAGDYRLTVDPTQILVSPQNTDLVHVAFASVVRVSAGSEVRVDVESPIVKVSDGVELVPGEETVVEPTGIPGLRIVIPADAATFPAGLPTNTLHAIELDYDDGPRPVHANIVPQVMIQILPEGIEFDPPAEIVYPDRDASPAGQDYVYFHFDSESDDWETDGPATSDGTQLVPATATRARRSGTHFVSCAAQRVTGVVHDQDTQPVAGARIALEARVHVAAREADLFPMDPILSVVTDASGRFSFEEIYASELNLRGELATAATVGRLEGIEPRFADGSGTIDFGELNMELQALTYFTLAGSVRGLNGFPAINVSVGWESSPIVKRRESQSTTGADGKYEMEVVAEPASEIWVWAYDEVNFLGGISSVVVPELSESGTLVEVDVDLCLETWGASPTLCGYAGTWSLSAERLSRTLRYESCDGEATLELPVWELLQLIDGVLTVNVLEAEPHVSSYTRVGGSGPSGLNPANLVGVYASEDRREILALYPSGRLHQLRSFFPGRGSTQYGSYSIDGSELTALYRYNDGDDGPPPGSEAQFDWARLGNELTLSPQAESHNYVSCPAAPDFGGIENLWLSSDDGELGLLFYAGEFAAVGD